MPSSSVRKNDLDISRALAVPGSIHTAIKEDDKTPVFLIKLWNIVNDPSFDHIIEWDESGLSFHIKDPYAFCKEVLPLYFKHSNLNSCVRQLNMYGFRKITTIEKSSLIGCQNAGDNLEFSHPCFIRGRYDMLCNIKRKLSTPKSDQQIVSAIEEVHSKGTSQFNKALIDEIKQLRERQSATERRVATLLKQNEAIWEEVEAFRAKYRMQQSVIRKLCSVINMIGRERAPRPRMIGKRQLLAIDEHETKRPRHIGRNIARVSTGNMLDSDFYLDDIVDDFGETDNVSDNLVTNFVEGSTTSDGGDQYLLGGPVVSSDNNGIQYMVNDPNISNETANDQYLINESVGNNNDQYIMSNSAITDGRNNDQYPYVTHSHF
ncbi:Heat shock factor (HSF)-type, DNA-binding domain and Winged helix-turn-helix DNA-binding domain-containing protein [Strongyloides ratti]|uniref:Heat shock factor (HSF)-type, DNA-binding domain and Winged helix-turn-helix DNA-binding domain-containing protein n=1 Tax=Strongyloides ratti TaxID=34506 RepID=A0A090L1N1_STRRB|nr:Heat shock factor (HSF)-type, DNA-binding domain and Winged helix-turn-helix DNA-binding domain-containing protein [Strongyloides ratti]CEF62027.1 Heat shock factor (HSF)-type, DNA-binding domain and Winged helix-turn-helix DNA-binding domain-containing protein [Strongyloides ratti]